MLFIYYIRLRHGYATSKKRVLLGQMVSAETSENVEEKYADYVEAYGEDDSSALCLAQYYMRAEEADKSRSMLFKLKNTTSIDYYCTMAEWYNKFDKGNFSYVVSTLLDAVAAASVLGKGTSDAGTFLLRKQ